MVPKAIDEIVMQLIQRNFLNEERFASAFASRQRRIKFWEKIRTVIEPKY
jgi:regulatory protein